MAKHAKVLIWHENSIRESLGNSLLKFNLEKNGFIVKIISMRTGNVLLRSLFFRPSFLIHNGFYQEKDFYRFFYLLKLIFSTVFVVNYTEQIINKNAKVNYTNNLVMKYNDLHLAWGNNFKEFLISLGVHKNYIYNTGNYRFDIANYVQDNKYRFSNDYNIPLEPKWILFVGGFPMRDDEKSIEEKSRTIIIKDIQKLAENEKDIQIIFRPHPKSSDSYLEYLDDYFKFNENVYVILENNILEWISSVDLYITWCSTSIFEAAMIKKPAFFYQPIDLKNLLDMDHYKYFERVDDYDLFLNKVHELLQTKNMNYNYNDFYQFYENFRSEELASLKIVNLIKDFSYSRKVPFKLQWIFLSLKFIAIDIVVSSKLLINRMLFRVNTRLEEFALNRSHLKNEVKVLNDKNFFELIDYRSK